MYRILPKLVFLYRKLPFKPFKQLLAKNYDYYKKFARNKTIICTVDGITYELDLNELIDSEIYFNGSFEIDTTIAMNNLCRRGMTVLDIGANIGCHTFQFAKLVGTTGRVIAFEPTSYAFKKLKRNFHLNNFNNLILEKIALSNENKSDCEISFRSSWPLDHKDRSKIHPIDHGQMGVEEIVSFVKLDDYLSQKKIREIDFIKLDVDGYEHKVIQGAIQTLRMYRPIIITELFSYTHEDIGDSVFDLVSLFEHLGYKFYNSKTYIRLTKNHVENVLRGGGGFNNILLRPEVV